MSFRNYVGLMSIVCNLINSFMGAIYLAWIVRQAHMSSCWISNSATASQQLTVSPCCMQVERAKKCLDFASTTYIVHLIAVCAFAGFPASLEW